MPRIHVKFSAVIVLATLIAFSAPDIIFASIAAAAVHECGHLAAMYLCRVRPDSLTLYPFGINIGMAGRVLSYREEVVVSLAGCAVNIIAAVLFCGTMFARVCAVYACVNLLPVSPLDGGRALRSALLIRLEPDRTVFIMRIISLFCLIPMWAAAVYILFYSSVNITPLLMCCYLFASVFVSKTEIF